MKKTATIICALIFSLTISSTGQTPKYFGIKLGGALISRCKHTVIIKGFDIIRFEDWATDSIQPTFEIYNNQSIIAATVAKGKISGVEASKYTIIKHDQDWLCKDKITGRVICYIKKVESELPAKFATQLNVSMDLRLPDGNYFQCSSESSNLNMLENMKGATFLGGGSVIEIN